MLRKVGISKSTTKSDPNVIGNIMDTFTSAKSAKFVNKKLTEIANRIYEESVKNRKEKM